MIADTNTAMSGRPTAEETPAERHARVAPFERHAFEPADTALGSWCKRCGRVRERGAHLP